MPSLDTPFPPTASTRKPAPRAPHHPQQPPPTALPPPPPQAHPPPPPPNPTHRLASVPAPKPASVSVSLQPFSSSPVPVSSFGCAAARQSGTTERSPSYQTTSIIAACRRRLPRGRSITWITTTRPPSYRMNRRGWSWIRGPMSLGTSRVRCRADDHLSSKEDGSRRSVCLCEYRERI